MPSSSDWATCDITSWSAAERGAAARGNPNSSSVLCTIHYAPTLDGCRFPGVLTSVAITAAGIVDPKDVEIGERPWEDADRCIHGHHAVRTGEVACSADDGPKPAEAKHRRGTAAKLGFDSAAFHHVGTNRASRPSVAIMERKDSVGGGDR